MNRTTLVAFVALALGLLLAAGGSVILAHARAAVRSASPRHPTISQYPAALSALLGFLITSVAGAALCWRLAPVRGATAVLAAIVAGVVLFALIGAASARIADRVEARQLRQVPAEVRRPLSPAPFGRPALTSAARPDLEAASGGNSTSTGTQRRSEAPYPHPSEGPYRLPLARLAPSTILEAVSPAPTSPAAPPEASAATTPMGQTLAGPAGVAPASASVEPSATTLQAGWMYHDDAERWFLAVGSRDGRSSLLGLPSFTLVDPHGQDAPVGALHRAGAAELTVLPEPACPGPACPEPAVPEPTHPEPTVARAAQTGQDTATAIPAQRPHSPPPEPDPHMVPRRPGTMPPEPSDPKPDERAAGHGASGTSPTATSKASSEPVEGGAG